MYRFTLSLVTFMVSLRVGDSAIIQLPIADKENLKSNLIEYESYSVEGLTPPMVEAKNYFSSQSDISDFKHPYVVEINRNYISLQTRGLPSQKIKLNQTEREGIQKLSLSFVRLLNSSKLSSQEPENEIPDWKDVSPVITLSNSGVSLQFLNTSKVDDNATDISQEHRQILWDFLTKYTRNIFEEKLKQLKITEKYAEVFASPVDATPTFAFDNFVNFLWNVMKLSVDYAETAFEGWTTSRPETPKTDGKFHSEAFLAYEEPSPFHEFPSQEFLFRRKDLDVIFYGRGVI